MKNMVPVVALVLLSSSAVGCSPRETTEEVVDEVICNIGIAPDRERRGSEDTSTLFGVCRDDTCNADTPLAVGSDHTFSLKLDTETLDDLDVHDLTFVSDEPEVLSVDRLRTDITEERDPDTGELARPPISVELLGTLHVRGAGRGTLRLVHAGETLDRFDLRVAEIHEAHVELLRDDVPGDDLAMDGLLLAVGAEAKVAAIATSKDGHPLVLSPANVIWTVDDGETVDLRARPFFQTCGVRGPGAEMEGLAEGMTEVHVSIGDIEQIIEVWVAD